jgi:hypothetical protein
VIASAGAGPCWGDHPPAEAPPISRLFEPPPVTCLLKRAGHPPAEAPPVDSAGAEVLRIAAEP